MPNGANAFKESMAELGWIEGRNLQIESRLSEGTQEILTTLAAELVRAKVQVILAAPSVSVRAAKEATPTHRRFLGETPAALRLRVLGVS